jgi:hypothetical protein
MAVAASYPLPRHMQRFELGFRPRSADRYAQTARSASPKPAGCSTSQSARKTYKVWFRLAVPRCSDGWRPRTQCPNQMAALSTIPIAPMNPLNPSTIQASRLGDRAARLTFADAASVSRASAIR